MNLISVPENKQLGQVRHRPHVERKQEHVQAQQQLQEQHQYQPYERRHLNQAAYKQSAYKQSWPAGAQHPKLEVSPMLAVGWPVQD